ncbi:MAG: hypothetical protein ACREKS_00280 [Candidatus Rokuibacteriota bacterium]
MITCGTVRSSIVILALATVCAGPEVLGFELHTHQRITDKAFSRPTLAGVFQDLGLDPDRPLSGGLLRGSRLPMEWLIKGALDEDDIVSINPLRFRNHFYDPVNNRGLDTPLAAGERAPDWGLEDGAEFITQRFSYRDARAAFFAALTAREPGDRETALADTFEALGHVLHLVQDMASPPHTRNDIHGGIPGFGPQSLFERHVDDVADGLNFDGTPVSLSRPRDFWITGDGRGLAEFTNRNFVSEGTNFSARAEGAIGGGYASPVLRLGVDDRGKPFEEILDIQERVDPGLRDRKGNLIEGTLTFFANVFHDPMTGQRLRIDRMTTLSLFDRELERRNAQPLFSLNRYNIEAQAAFLIPRAVGYSTGLLDYFFRGTLELDFSPDPTTTTRLLLTAMNRSDETLGPGATPATLTVHVDDPPSGIREERARLDVTSPVGPHGSFPSLPIDATLEFSSMTVVYRGRLGREEGAVIGKVQAAPEVEQIFRGASDWMLRTADGIFPLGLGTAPGQVKWGDRDNTLVARTFLSGGDQRFQGYRINRPEGSPNVPLTPNPVGPLQMVDLIPIGPPVTLNGQAPIDLGTRLSVSQVVDYTQQLGTVQVTYLYAFDPEIDNWKVVDKKFVGGSVQTVHEQPFSRQTPSVALIMSPATRSLPQATTSPFFWIPGSFYLNPEGDVLVDVSVRLTTPSASVPLVRHDASGNLIGDGRFGFGFVSFATPEPPFEFVVNLTRRTVVAKTCADTIDFIFRNREGGLLVDLQAAHVTDQTTTVFGPATILGPATGETTAFDVALRAGTIQAWSTPGVYRGDFTNRGFWNGTDITFRDVVSGTEVVAFRDPLLVGGNPSLGGAMRQTAFQTDEASRIMVLAELRRSDGPGEGYLVLGWQANLSFEKWTPHRWRPLTGTVTAPLAGLTLPTDVNTTAFTRGANRGTAMFRTSISQGPSFTHLVTERDEVVFTGATGSTVANQYQLLQPNVLFNTSDLRFHRLSPELEVLPAPRPLAPGGPASGEYHVVGRP